MQLGTHILDRRLRGFVTQRMAIWLGIAAAMVVVAGAITLVANAAGSAAPSGIAVRSASGQPAARILSGSPDAITADLARDLFTSAPAVVVADDGSHDLAAAAAIAGRLHAPVIMVHGPQPTAASIGPARAAIAALHPGVVLAVGVTAAALKADLPAIKVVSKSSALPHIAAVSADRHLVVLIHRGESTVDAAVTATAEVAGVRVITASSYDPQTQPAVIKALAAARPVHVIAVGAGFGSTAELTARVSVAETGMQLPGGGQLLFPMRKFVALYGNPTTPALGALGQQDLTASIARARAVAGQYSTLSRVPVVPAFEIIATIAQGSPGRSGGFTYETKPAALLPWVKAATAAGMYVILDLQPGRDNFLAQARLYRSLLRRPNVGLALDPEWKLQPRQLPLHQIGSVHISEVNSVVRWLAHLTAQYRLPQKLLELHQFRLSMIDGESRLDTSHSDLAIVINMDGQGAPVTKAQTWAAIVSAAPKGVYFGWKDFYVKDKPMLDPRRTVRRSPRPVLISYQ
ncbi:MAG TPA: hypothetical protein VEV61_01055 [Streptosporangiaceae bacterium]|nr:hypothetical protein [Streptosporangiaceae bacterium]